MPHNKPLPQNVSLIGTTKTKTGQTKSLFSVTCLFCGKARNITRYDHATRLAKHRCKTCSNKNNHPQGEIHGIRVAWFNKYRISAEYRSLDWEIEIDDIAILLSQQAGRCALSGLWLVTRGPMNGITVSIDRIDNSLGYTISNIQLVHKKVNMMRGSLSIEEFQSFCTAVADRVKW